MGEDFTETSKEKFNKLAEEVEYKNEEDFKAKVSTIKELLWCEERAFI